MRRSACRGIRHATRARALPLLFWKVHLSCSTVLTRSGHGCSRPLGHWGRCSCSLSSCCSALPGVGPPLVSGSSTGRVARWSNTWSNSTAGPQPKGDSSKSSACSVTGAVPPPAAAGSVWVVLPLACPGDATRPLPLCSAPGRWDRALLFLAWRAPWGAPFPSPESKIHL
jgi:hypothetical protein